MAGESQIVNCFHCGSPFDALKAPWCSCVGRDRTLVCPGCLSCFCQAPRGYLQSFWAAATPPLRAAHLAALQQALPLRPNPAPEAVARPLVLAVDDEPHVVRLILRAVEAIACGCIHAGEAGEALRLAQLYRPALVVCDALMPGMDGRELCGRLKDLPLPPRVVVMSGVYTSTWNAAEARHKYRADDFLAKPFTFLQLHALLRRLLERPEAADPRATQRHACQVTLLLEREPVGGAEPEGEITLMENVGTSGALVRTSLPIGKGEVVDLRQAAGPFRARAAVRQVTIGADGIPRLHLEFLFSAGLGAVLRGA